MLRVLPSRPSAFPLLLFFFFLPPPSDESFLPAKALPSSSHQLVGLPRWSFKPNSSMAPSNTLSLLCCVSRSRSQLIFTYVNMLMLWSSVFLPRHKPTIDPRKGERPRRKSSVRCSSSRANLFRMKERLFFWSSFAHQPDKMSLDQLYVSVDFQVVRPTRQWIIQNVCDY